MEYMAKIAFGFYTLIILAGSILAVGAKSLVRSMVGLIATLLGVAGMYMLLNAQFMALMQILIYVGAICVLIFFAIMLTRADDGGEEAQSASVRQNLLALLAVLSVGGILGWLVLTRPLATTGVPVEVTIEKLGLGLLGTYGLAFELISVVLLVSMAGAVLLTWERRNGK
ncbi:MAG: NADH-quinone oxidoreductase subunit J [Proteobacteria bacterium]|nr:NADH-quinone oxidoreductase subunit J [Pseudomonadota bacterium]MBU1593965.1 NADH-quinone oxidoreductase subunit J [Pseudomonadota bacterium]